MVLKNLKLYTVVISLLVLWSCGNSDEDCTKTISIPQAYFVNGQTYTREFTQEVPCDFPEPTETEIIEPPRLENFSYQILNFNYIPDTGNNTLRLQFDIQLNNNNNFDVTGIPYFTTNSDGLIVSGASYSQTAINPCFSINANSNCIFSYDQEEPLDIGLAPGSIQIINVEYIVTD